MRDSVITAMMLLEMMHNEQEEKNHHLSMLAHSVLQVGFCGTHSLPRAREYLLDIEKEMECKFNEDIVNAPSAIDPRKYTGLTLVKS